MTYSTMGLSDQKIESSPSCSCNGEPLHYYVMRKFIALGISFSLFLNPLTVAYPAGGPVGFLQSPEKFTAPAINSQALVPQPLLFFFHWVFSKPAL